jgi:histidinol-phosphate aminotransferase
MQIDKIRRNTLKGLCALSGASIMKGKLAFAGNGPLQSEPSSQRPIRLSFHENPYGPSSAVFQGIQNEFSRLNRYADDTVAQDLVEEIARYENLPVEHVVLGDILDFLGQYLGSRGGQGAEFIYSIPGYLALINAAVRAGGVGVPVPLNKQYQNDLPALHKQINQRTQAIYLVNPHSPTGTTNVNEEFKRFLRESCQQAVVIVDEAYLEYTSEFRSHSAVSLVRSGANVIVFRTFDKIHALAGMPIGYLLAPRALAGDLRNQGAGDAASLGRLNIVAASAALRDIFTS